jgi:hypothetical protein
LHAITDFVVLVTRLTTEEFADEQWMTLIDQFMGLHGFDAAFEFDLHDLLMILITILIIFFCRARGRTDRWPFPWYKRTRKIGRGIFRPADADTYGYGILRPGRRMKYDDGSS